MNISTAASRGRCRLYGRHSNLLVMKKGLITLLLILLCFYGYSQSTSYEVYTIRFGGPWFAKLSEIAADASEKDSIEGCQMFWLLKGNGKNILVDAGYLLNEIGTSAYNNYPVNNYIRPDSALLRIGIAAKDITDIIITHPHFDHIGGIGLFPSAQLWMQQDDYDYFVGKAWQKNNINEGFYKEDVKDLVTKNLDGKLTLIKGDSIEIFPGIRTFIGSKHTWESQYLLVTTKADKVIIASDNCTFYYNLEHLVTISKNTFDTAAYVQQIKRMRILQPNLNLIIPGHDALVFSKFPKVAEGIVKIR